MNHSQEKKYLLKLFLEWREWGIKENGVCVGEFKYGIFDALYKSL
jgi:hypothetical protein